MNRLEKILRPKSIAIIGASRKEGSLGKMFVDAILRMDYKGTIYPVNPKAEEISAIKAYPNLASLPLTPELAVILLAHPFVPDTLKAVGEAGIKDVVVISAGFREVGGAGIEREQQLIELAKEYNFNLLGPNCMGVFNTQNGVSFNGTFSPTLPKAGHVAFVSQSGALGVAIMELSAETDLGFSVFVSTGNKADITDNDVLEFLAEDENSKVITLYLESIDEPKGFKKIAQSIVANKPLLAVKAGRTESGLKAASSHTGALANPEYIIDGFFKQCGVIRKNSLEELFDSARALAIQHLPKGPSVAIVTNAGGPGILASDSLESAGLKLAVLTPSTIKKLSELLPDEAAVQNPVDMIASADHETYKSVVELVMTDENVDSVLLIMVKPPVNTTPIEIIKNVGVVVQSCGKTVIPVLMAQKGASAGIAEFEKLKLPVYAYPESAVKVLGTMWEYSQIQHRFRKSDVVVATPKTNQQLHSGSGDTNKQIPMDQLSTLLKEYDIRSASFVLSEDVNEILTFKKSHEKIVLKIANEQIIHKSDAGLVKINLSHKQDVEEAFNNMHTIATQHLPETVKPLFMAQQQLPAGIELVIGGKRDPIFGPIIMVGIGGVFIEVLKDVSFRVAPLNLYQAKEMIEELRSQPLLNGFRGNAVINRDQFAYTIQRFSLLFAEQPEIIEMDLNPLIWAPHAGEAVVVDVRATLK